MFSREVLQKALPRERIEAFLEAFYFGEEPAYDMELAFGHFDSQEKLLTLEIRLRARPGQCLACNLTWGLPRVFRQHPLLDLASTVKTVEAHLPNGWRVREWDVGFTEERGPDLHVIPLWLRLS